MVCHGELVRRRPHPQHRVRVYLWLSLGGVLGSLQCADRSSLFNMLWEYRSSSSPPAVASLLQQENPLRERMYDLLYPAIITLLLPEWSSSGAQRRFNRDLLARAVVLGFADWRCFSKRPLRFGFTIGVLVILGILHLSGERNMIYRTQFLCMHRVETEMRACIICSFMVPPRMEFKTGSRGWKVNH